MADSYPERDIHRAVLLDGATIGVALGSVGLAGGSMVLFRSGGLLLATAGLIASMVVALLVGMWVSAPAIEQEDPAVRERWLTAILSVALAGAYATFLQLNDVLAAGALGRVSALLLLAALPAYSLGLAIPVLLGWGRFRVELVTGEIVGESVTSSLTAGVLGGVAIGVVGTGYMLIQGVAAGPALLGAAAVLMAPLLRHSRMEPLAREQLLHEVDTPYHTLRVTEVVHPGDRQPERRLYLDGEEESGELVRSGAPTLAYIAAAEAWLSERSVRGGEYLFLGGGAYTLPRRVAERDPSARVTVVELDPEVTSTAYRFFGLRPHHNIRSVHGDARAYLEGAGEDRFDRIYVDVYGGQESLPPPLITLEAFQLMRDRLRPGGLVAVNVIGTTHGLESTRFWSMVETFSTAFAASALYLHLGRDFPERQNALLAGAVDAGVEFPERAGLFDRWLPEEWPAKRETTLLRDLAREDSPREPRRPGAEGLLTTKGER